MHLKDWLFFKRQGLAQRLGRKVEFPAAPFRMPEDRTKDDYRHRASSPLARLFLDHEGRGVTKWVDYLDLYDRHLSPFRGKGVRMLEIGVLKGGSLEVWREYFGAEATLFGVDIEPRCAERVDAPNQVRIGSQDDPAFLGRVVEEMGGVDLVLDDGSHRGEHQIASFEALFPRLSEGGLYMIEDLHTSFWPGLFSGGYRRRGTGIELIKQLIDDMHSWYHDKGDAMRVRDSIRGIHVYDSIVIIEKGRKERPVAIEHGM
nr:class I SAM-dependent methyltransferase [uncultured Sphingomonas sp.]